MSSNSSNIIRFPTVAPYEDEDEIITWAFKSGIESTARFILATLAHEANKDGQVILDIKRLSALTGLHPRTVQLKIRTLQESHLITNTGKRIKGCRVIQCQVWNDDSK
jgi:DNA-binding transcriptional ArsR family regulator